jgi:sulfate adenylyltransferase large subunit
MLRQQLSIVIVGHVDHGKSTLVGRLLYDTKSIPEDSIEELRNASSATDNELEFAFLLDHLREEREQGITIDTTQTFFHTENREYRIIDAPGHVEFVKNMITGASQTNSAILIVDAKEGVQQQTKRHAYILSLLGIKNLIIVINKMDKVGYLQTVYEEVVRELEVLLKRLNLSSQYYIPVSALKGDNICSFSTNMGWYKGQNLLGILEQFDEGEERQEDFAIFSAQDVYRIGDKRISVGRVEAGKISVGDKISVMQSSQTTKIKSIEVFQKEKNEAACGECIGLTFEDPIFVDRGNILCTNMEVLTLINTFDASIIWLGEESIAVNESCMIKCDVQEVSGKIVSIKRKINTSDFGTEEKECDTLNYLDAAEVKIETKEKIVIANFNQLQCIGRFVIVTDSNINAGGVVI